MNQLVERCVLQNCSWIKLPDNVKEMVSNSQSEYDRVTVEVSIKHQIRFRGNLVQRVRRDEQSYYEQLIAFSRRHLLLYPYHLSDIVTKGLRLTPFQYYVNIVHDILLAERSYDTLPNFTAADTLRLLGIGRNQYIELMNQCRRGVRPRSGFRKRVVYIPQLPAQPVAITILPGWLVDVGQVMEDDVKFLTSDERTTIDCLIDKKSQPAGHFARDVISSLYRKGLIYIDIPVEARDLFSVPPLEGFVMNRVQGDYFEKLLYKIFVSIDETISVGELASLLQIDESLVKNAVSVFCRLGFACQKTVTQLAPSALHATWSDDSGAATAAAAAAVATEAPSHSATADRTTSDTTGNDRESTDDPWISQLQRALSSDSTGSGSRPAASRPATAEPPGDESEHHSSVRPQQRIALLYDSVLTAYLMMGNLSAGLKQHAVTMFEVGKLPDEALASLLAELDRVDPGQCEGEARRYFVHALALRHTLQSIRCRSEPPPLAVDLVRCESLQSLDPDVCSRLLRRNYRVMVSVCPLSMESQCLSWQSVPPHFAPPTPAVNSVWFKLFLYHVTGSGPPTYLLVRGTCLHQLPAALWRYDRLLVTSWGHNAVAIPTCTALLTINDALPHAAVLVQGLGWRGDGDVRHAAFPASCDRLETAEALCPAVATLRRRLQLDSSCGFVTLLNLTPPPSPVASPPPVPQQTPPPGADGSADDAFEWSHCPIDDEATIPWVVPVTWIHPMLGSRHRPLSQHPYLTSAGATSVDRTLVESSASADADREQLSVKLPELQEQSSDKLAVIKQQSVAQLPRAPTQPSAKPAEGLERACEKPAEIKQQSYLKLPDVKLQSFDELSELPEQSRDGAGVKNGVCSVEAGHLLLQEVDACCDLTGGATTMSSSSLSSSSLLTDSGSMCHGAAAPERHSSPDTVEQCERQCATESGNQLGQSSPAADSGGNSDGNSSSNGDNFGGNSGNSGSGGGGGGGSSGRSSGGGGGGGGGVGDVECDADGVDWVLLECHLGLPLFDLSLCRQVTDTLFAAGTFSDARLDQLNNFNRNLVSELQQFIQMCQSLGDGWVSSELCRADTAALHGPPSVSLCFVDGQLSQLIDY